MLEQSNLLEIFLLFKTKQIRVKIFRECGRRKGKKYHNILTGIPSVFPPTFYKLFCNLLFLLENVTVLIVKYFFYTRFKGTVVFCCMFLRAFEKTNK